MTQTFDLPQATATTFLIQVKRLIQEEGSAVTPAKSVHRGGKTGKFLPLDDNIKQGIYWHISIDDGPNV
jgi:hypothetical protein